MGPKGEEGPNTLARLGCLSEDQEWTRIRERVRCQADAPLINLSLGTQEL